MNTHHTSVQPDLFSTAHETPAMQVREVDTWAVPVFRVQLVKERSLSGPMLYTPREVATLLCRYLEDCDREHFVALMFSTANQVVGINTVSIGTLNAALVCPREVFKPAILANAASIIVAHNHPSGNLEPSVEDVRVTRQLVEAGKLLQIAVLDSLIIGHNRQYTSLAERGLLG